jgi:hypothetical protein
LTPDFKEKGTEENTRSTLSSAYSLFKRMAVGSNGAEGFVTFLHQSPCFVQPQPFLMLKRLIAKG